MRRWMIVSLTVALSFTSVAHAQNVGLSRGQVLWTVAGTGAGFGVGLWAGLSAFDQAVNSDRKVWTSAIVGAGAGGVAGYLIGRARGHRHRPSATAAVAPTALEGAVDPRLLDQVAKSVRFPAPIPPARLAATAP